MNFGTRSILTGVVKSFMDKIINEEKSKFMLIIYNSSFQLTVSTQNYDALYFTLQTLCKY